MERFVIPVSKILGLTPFNHRQPVASCVDYILMMILPVAYVSCHTTVYLYSETLPQVVNCHTICASGHYMFIQMGMFMYTFSFIFNLVKRRFYTDFASALDDIKSELSKCRSKFDAKGVKNRRFKIIVFGSIAVAFNIGMLFDVYNMFQMMNNLFPLIIIAYAFPYLVGCVVQMQFISFINSIAEQFQQLNEILEMICSECDEQKNFQFKLFDVETDFVQKTAAVAKVQDEKKTKEEASNDTEDKQLNTERFLVNVFKIHDKLCEAGVLANRAYAIQIVTYMTVTFIITVFGIFLETKVIFLVGGINIYLDHMAHSYALWAITLSLVAYIVLRLCCQVQRESKRSALLVHAIMQRKPAFMLGNDIYYNRMKCFTLQYLHWENYYHFNGIGLFRLDYTFIFSAISAATSYLIVLLQFDLTSEITK